MTGLFKKIALKLTAAALVIVMAPFCAVDAAAASLRDVWSVDHSSPVFEECTGWIGNGSSVFSVDTKNFYKDSRYSIKITNKDYNVAYVEKTFDVEPNTTYRFSAMVKYSGYEIDPKYKGTKSGGCVGQAYSYNVSDFTTSKNWTKVAYQFTTGNETEYKLCLQNGIFNGDCKGTAWFSDVKLEKAHLTNDWTILAVVFRNVNAKVVLDGKKTTYKDHIDSSMEKKVKSTLKTLKTSLKSMSGGLISASKIDYVTVDDPVTELTDYHYDGDKWGVGEINGYMLDQEADCISKVLDKQLAKKQYNQIIVFAPLDGVSLGWGGLGGFYKSIPFAQINCYEWAFSDKEFPEGTIVHEMLHGLEYRSRLIDENKTPKLHSAPDFNYQNGSRKWYIDYMRAALPGGKGIIPSVYKVPSGKYTLISDDMTTGAGITKGSTSSVSLSDLKVAAIPDCVYNKKAQKPDVKITDGNYTLKRGTDYVISYSNNTEVGKATATVTGKGIYKGKIKANFNIVPKAMTIKVKKSGDKLKVSWSKVTGASKYSVWLSKDGKNFEKIAELDKDKLSTTVKYSSKHTYQFAITAYIPETQTYTSYVYSDVV